MDSYTPTSDELSKIDLVKHIALDWAAKDVRKASHMSADFTGYMDQSEVQKLYPWYDGGSMIGAVILGMCAIQHAACFTPNMRDGDAFIKFVEDYLGKPYKGDELYSLRNSLIKQYTTRCYVINQKGKELIYIIMNNRPAYWEQNPASQSNIGVQHRIIGYSRDGKAIWTDFKGGFDVRGKHIDIDGVIGFTINQESGKVTHLTEFFTTNKTPL